jgi:outer membrane lipoprotein carrier protein
MLRFYNMLKNLFLCLFFFVAPQIAFSDDEDFNQAKILIDKYFDSVSTMKAEFTQHILDKNDRKVELMKGSFFIEKPEKIRWQYIEPYEQIFLADGVNFWTYDVDLEQVTVKPQKEFLARAQFILFYDNNELMTKFEVASVDHEKEMLWIQLKPLRSNESGNEVILGFGRGILSEIKLVDSLDQTIIIDIKNLVLNQNIQSNIFELNLPLGVDILGEPLGLVN